MADNSGVIMKGGTSGCRHDYLPDVSRPYDKAVPQDTATKGVISSTIQWCQNTANGEPGEPGIVTSPTEMPTGGTPDDSAV